MLPTLLESTFTQGIVVRSLECRFRIHIPPVRLLHFVIPLSSLFWLSLEEPTLQDGKHRHPARGFHCLLPSVTLVHTSNYLV